LQSGKLFNEVGSSRWFISPEQSFHVVVLTRLKKGWTISHEEFEEMGGLEWTLVAYGRVEYEDTLNTGVMYTTDFCWVVQPDFDATATIKLLWIKGPDEHNRYT
jgi:hypothetical protein